MDPPPAPVVGSGDPANGGEWVVESSTSILSREPWLEVFEEHIRLPGGRLIDDFYTIRLRDFVVLAASRARFRLASSRATRPRPTRRSGSCSKKQATWQKPGRRSAATWWTETAGVAQSTSSLRPAPGGSPSRRQ